jgi:peptidoglycan hydrolase CwlO-like protein
MFRSSLFALIAGLVILSGGLVGQDTKTKEETKKDDPPVKVKGTLPPNWKKLGLTDTQVQDVYKVQHKYNEEIEKLEAKVKELKSNREKEMKAVLTPEQKKRLEEILTGKDK